MLATPPPFSGHRKPLQPKNHSATVAETKPCKGVSMLDTSNKENIPPFSNSNSNSYTTTVVEEADISLADELIAVREKLIRLKIEEERNEKVLGERGLMLDLEMKEIMNRGELQKELEVEVDRLYRLKQIKLACMRVSRLRSLRVKEEEKKMKHDHLNKSYIYIQGGRESWS